MKFEVKKSKKMQAREGYHWSAEIWVDGVRAVFVEDEGQGGPLEIRWFNSEKRREIEKHIATLPPEDVYGTMLKPSLDTFLAGIVDDWENNKTYRRWCKTRVCFRLKGDKSDNWRSMNIDFFHGNLEAAKTYLRKQHGKQLDEILNDRFTD